MSGTTRSTDVGEPLTTGPAAAAAAAAVASGTTSGAVAAAAVRADRERAVIIRAAHRLIGRHGSAATPMEDILRAAGVNRRTFYRHFPSKDALVLTMQREAGNVVQGALRAAVDQAVNGRAAAVAWVEEFLAIGWDERRSRDGRTFLAPEVGLVAGITDALENVHSRHGQILVEALRRGRDDGSLPGVEPGRDAFAVHAVVLRCLEMRARGRLDQPYASVRDDVVALLTRRRA